MSDSTFEFDPYAEFGPITADADDYPDAAKLRLLADWFDRKDAAEGITDNLVQRDLRRIAERLDDVAEREFWRSLGFFGRLRYRLDVRRALRRMDSR